MTNASLVSSTNRVESPFIILEVGKYTFGKFTKQGTNNITFPKYMQSINIVKVNGAINTYTIKLDYAITELDDPNLLEKVFSSVSESRTVYISYGDCSAPNYIFKREEAIITKLQTNVSVETSKISYTLSCTSSALSLKSSSGNFPAKVVKPSQEIKNLLLNVEYGLTDIFTGMRNIEESVLENLILCDDKEVQIEAKNGINVFDYISYLVQCMVPADEDSETIYKSRYVWAVFDDYQSSYGGPYFRVTKISQNGNYSSSFNTYEVDVGYPSSVNVTAFTINNDDSWSLLYKHSLDTYQPQQAYKIDNNGKIIDIISPSILSSRNALTATPTDKAWWTNVTQFPISAVITIRGLLRPAMLLSYLRVNTYFYGNKHISSGLYIITKQQDQIDSSGYKTTLSLLRVGGD